MARRKKLTRGQRMAKAVATGSAIAAGKTVKFGRDKALPALTKATMHVATTSANMTGTFIKTFRAELKKTSK